jgi:hypothetical protein
VAHARTGTLSERPLAWLLRELAGLIEAVGVSAFETFDELAHLLNEGVVVGDDVGAGE